MRIEGITPTGMYNQTGKIHTDYSKPKGLKETDKVELSNDAVSFAAMFNQIKGSLIEESNIQDKSIEKRLSLLSTQIKNGTYNVDSKLVAEKMIRGIEL